MISIMKNRYIWFLISGIIIGTSVAALVLWGLKLGIDFTGGSLLEIEFKNNLPTIETLTKELTASGLLKNVTIQPGSVKHILFRFQTVDEDIHQKITQLLREKFDKDLIEIKFDSIGPSIGQELKQKTIIALILSLCAIIIYIAWAFRKVSKPVSSINYGVIAIIALIHDILVVLGVFSFLGRFYEVEVGATFIAALLTVLGYSVNDTIVIFDRIRENLKKYYEGNLEEIIEKSLFESIRRSLYTSFTVLLVLLAIFFYGGETIKDFSLALIIGIISGSYSTIFLASPLLVIFEKFIDRRFRKTI